jgi:superfamily II DNA helicase RecQ
MTKKEAEEIASTLQSCRALKGVVVDFYHAGMSMGERTRVHKSFTNDMIQIVIATVAFGMGIHKVTNIMLEIIS